MRRDHFQLDRAAARRIGGPAFRLAARRIVQRKADPWRRGDFAFKRWLAGVGKKRKIL